MTQPANQSRLAPLITATLANLKRRIRTYVCLEGVAVALAWLGLAFWLSLAIDWLPVTMGNDEPSAPIRGLILVVAGVVLLAVIFWLIVRRIFVPMSDRNMAVVLERRFAEYDDSLLTTVEMSEEPTHAANFSADMLERTGRTALEQTGQVRLARVFNPYPLVRSMALAVVLSLSVVGFAVAAPGPFGIWLDRYVGLGDRLWPRRCHIEIEGPTSRKVARGTDATITVNADTSKEVPRVVRIYYEYDDGSGGRENMVREGDPTDGQQKFTYTFRALPNSVNFEVLGGDHRVRDYRIEAVDSPTAELGIYCEYPEYMVDVERDLYTPRELPVAGVMQLPQGTRVTVRAEANKPLESVEVTFPGPQGIDQRQPVPLPETGAQRFEFLLESLDTDTTLLFRLHDTDGIESREPVRLSLAAVPDEIPQVEMLLRGVGLAVTPEVRIPVQGQITDDYGVTEIWYEFAVEDREPQQVPFAERPDRRTEIVFEPQDDVKEETEALDLREWVRNALKAAAEAQPDGQTPGEGAAGADDEAAAGIQLVPGQKILLAIKARDGHALEGGPHVGTSQRFLLEVVTPERLRAILAGRELNLRQRFEGIIDEVLDTRFSLAEIKFTAAEPADEPAAAEPTDGASGESDADGEGDEAPRRVTPERLRALASLRAQRAQQDSAKNANETLGVANGFDDIRDELINNRLYTEELNKRLQEGIAEPLRNIAGPMFDELDKRLIALDEAIADEAERGPALAAAQQQTDAILVEMDTVLARMIEYEHFNQAIELMREIVELQKQLNQETSNLRRSRLLNPQE